MKSNVAIHQSSQDLVSFVSFSFLSFLFLVKCHFVGFWRQSWGELARNSGFLEEWRI